MEMFFKSQNKRYKDCFTVWCPSINMQKQMVQGYRSPGFLKQFLQNSALTISVNYNYNVHKL